MSPCQHIGLLVAISVIGAPGIRRETVSWEGALSRRAVEEDTNETNDEEDSETLHDAASHPFAEYYSQVFRPVLQGYDFRSLAPPELVPDISRERLSAPSSSDSQASIADVEGNEMSASSLQSQVSFAELNGTVAEGSEAEVECDVCQWSVQWIAERCCVTSTGDYGCFGDSGIGHCTCSFATPGCERFVHLRAMYDSAKEKYGWKFDCSTHYCRLYYFDRYRMLRRVWADLSALGTVLHRYQEKKNTAKKGEGANDLKIATEVCQEVIRETFDCEHLPKLNNDAVKHSDHRNMICTNNEQRWVTWNFCKDSTGLETGGNTYDKGGEALSKRRKEEGKRTLLHTSKKIAPTHSSGTNGLGGGFPEIEIKYKGGRWQASDKSSQQWRAKAKKVNQILGRFPEIEIIRKDDRWQASDEAKRKFPVNAQKVNDILGRSPEIEIELKGGRWQASDEASKTFPGNAQRVNDILGRINEFGESSMKNALRAKVTWEKGKFKGQAAELNPYLIQKELTVILYRRKHNRGPAGNEANEGNDYGGTWWVENIPKGAAHLLSFGYNPSSNGRWLGKMFMDLDKLQSIGWSRGIAGSQGFWGAEDPTTTQAKIKGYMTDYQVNLNEVAHIDPSKGRDAQITDAVNFFETYNHFFFRKLKLGTRSFMCYHAEAETCMKDKHVTYEDGTKINWEEKTFVSPADSRVIAYSEYNVNQKKDTFWVKGEAFSLNNIVDFADSRHYDYYDGGMLIIFRLAPQDYHRFHFPVDGVIKDFKNYPGNAYSVNPIAVQNNTHYQKKSGKKGTEAAETSSPVFTTNKRMHTIIETGEKQFGCVLYISVGATNVMSVMHTSYVGQKVVRGMEHGYMAFGGSTVIAVVRKGVMELDADIKEMSGTEQVETILQIGDHVGKLKTGRDREALPPGSQSPCR